MRLKNINRRKLNNKGFTLIELLAVVVILAIVMGIAATSVLNSINNSRKSSLYSTAQNAANTLNTWISEDMIVTDNDKKKLGDAFVTASQSSGSWICFNKTTTITNGENAEAPLYTALGLSESDILIETDKTAPTSTTASATANCSAYRYNKSTGAYEVLLVAKPNGKFWVSNNGTNGANNYAFSRADAAGKDNID